jgi:hypothetical protein
MEMPAHGVRMNLVKAAFGAEDISQVTRPQSYDDIQEDAERPRKSRQPSTLQYASEKAQRVTDQEPSTVNSHFV